MAGTGRVKAELVLSEDERVTLERWARRPKSAQRSGAAIEDRAGVCLGSIEPRGGQRSRCHAGHGRQVAQPLRGPASRGPQRRAPLRGAALHFMMRWSRT